MKKILRFKKQLSFLMLLILLCGLIAPVSGVKAEEREYNLHRHWSDSRITIFDKDSYKYGLMDYNGKVIVEPQYDEIELFSEGLASAKKDGKWGCIDKDGRVIIPIKFDGVGYFRNGFADVSESNGRTGFINKKGEITYIRKNLRYDYIGDVSEGLYRVNIRGKEGYLNLKGKVVIPFKYDYSEDFSEGLAVVRKNGKWGFINKKGKVVVPIKYEMVRGFLRGIAAVKKNDKWGFVNKRGKVVIPFIYDSVSRMTHAYNAKRIYSAKNPAPTSWMVLRYVESWKDIDEKGTVLFVHPDPTASPEELSFINKEGKKVDLSDYIYAGLFNDGRCLVQGKNGKWGYIDDNGNPITNLEYDIDYYTGNGFHDGVAMVYKDGKYGFIDREGKVVVPIKYGIFR